MIGVGEGRTRIGCEWTTAPRVRELLRIYGARRVAVRNGRIVHAAIDIPPGGVLQQMTNRDIGEMRILRFARGQRQRGKSGRGLLTEPIRHLSRSAGIRVAVLSGYPELRDNTNRPFFTTAIAPPTSPRRTMSFARTTACPCAFPVSTEPVSVASAG